MKKFFLVFGYCTLICIAASAFYGRWQRVVGCIIIAVVIYTVVGIPYLLYRRYAKPKEGDIIINKRTTIESDVVNKTTGELAH